MRTIKIASFVLFYSGIITAPLQAQAKEAIEDKFIISLGGYTVSRYESELSLTDRDVGAGVSISPEDTSAIQRRTYLSI